MFTFSARKQKDQVDTVEY